MKIFNAQQMRDWDKQTIAEQNITSLDLIERAAGKCFEWIVQQKYNSDKIKIVCGKGNNGGDGLVVARHLSSIQTRTEIYIANWDDKESDDFKTNLERLENTNVDIFFMKEETDFPIIEKDNIIIDCLFGFGLNRPVEGKYAALINYINETEVKVISIDIPSGMFTDKSSAGNVIIKALETLTFQATKLCFLMADNAEYFGDVHILPIGLSEKFADQTDAKFEITDANKAFLFYKKRKAFSHKGTYGHALLLAGSEGKIGAAVMSATSCLRSGVGLLTCSLLPDYFSIIHTTIPEAMVVARENEGDLSRFSVVGMGPGLGTDEDTAAIVHSLIQQVKHPVVIDADALNIISKHTEWLTEVPHQSVFTPHPKEFDRLFSDSRTDFERMEKAVAEALKNNIVIVLKGTYTLVTDGKRNYFNSTGNNGLATGGSGDLLTGLITGLISQKYLPFEAAVLSVFIHGLAADLSLEEQSYESMLPMDVVLHFGKAFQQLQKNKGA